MQSLYARDKVEERFRNRYEAPKRREKKVFAGLAGGEGAAAGAWGASWLWVEARGRPAFVACLL